MRRTSAFFQLLLLVLCYASVVIVHGIFDQTGAMSNDSMFYLQIAQTYLDGQPHLIHGQFNTLWPPAFSASVAGISALTGLSLFWSGKAVQIILLVFIAALVFICFKEEAPVYFALLGFAPVLFNFVMTHSESMFITLLLCFVLVAHAAYTYESSRACFLFGLMLLLLSAVRYAGFIFALPIVLMAVWFFFRGKMRQGLAVGSGLLVSSAAIGLWMHWSREVTGAVTGAVRTFTDRSFGESLFEVVRALIDDLNLTMVFGNRDLLLFGVTLGLQFLIFLRFIYKWYGFSIRPRFPIPPPFTQFCFAAAAFFLAAMVAVHFLFGFFGFYYRFTGPSVFLFFAGLTAWILATDHQRFIRLYKQAVYLVVFLSLTINGPFWLYQQLQNENAVTRTDNELRISYFYKDVVPQSVVVFGHRELLYLRPDIAVEQPLFEPVFDRTETWEAFLERIQRLYPDHEHLLLSVPAAVLDRPYHPSVFAATDARFTSEMTIQALFSEDE